MKIVQVRLQHNHDRLSLYLLPYSICNNFRVIFVLDFTYLSIKFIYFLVPIGLGKAEVTISRNMEGFLSMKAGQEAQILGIFGKELFLIETDEEDKRRGFVSQKLFRELKLRKKGLIKSNVTALQRPRLKQMKAKETVEEEKQPEVVPQKNESEVPDIKQTVQERTPAGQVVLPKEEASKLEMQEKNVTEKTEEEDEDEGEKC